MIFILELCIIGLIFVEIIIGIAGIVIGIREARAQAQLIGKQTKALQLLQSTTERMSAAVQQQLGLMAHGSVDIGYSSADKRLDITNTGTTSLTIWGYRFGNERPQMLKQPSNLTRGGTYPIPVGAHFAKDLSQPSASQSFPLAFAVYLRGENETEFVAATVLTVAWSLEVVQVTHPAITMTERRWSGER